MKSSTHDLRGEDGRELEPNSSRRDWTSVEFIPWSALVWSSLRREGIDPNPLFLEVRLDKFDSLD